MHKNFLLLSFSAQSAFGRVEISINDVFVNSSCGLHHHRAFILNSVNYSVSARNSHLSLAGYETDIVEPESTKFTRNLALTTRAIYTDGGKVATTYGKLSHDLVSLTRVLPVGKCCSRLQYTYIHTYARRKNTQYSTTSCCKMYKYLSHRCDIMQRKKIVFVVGTKIGVRLHRNSDELILMVDDTIEHHKKKRYRMQIRAIELEVLRLRLEPEVISIMESALSNSCAKYHFPRLELRTVYIPPGIYYIYIHKKHDTTAHVLACYVLEIAFFETDRYVHRFIY